MAARRLIGLVLLTAAARASAVDEPPRTASAALGGENGQALFRSYCASCHGATARGDGPLADSLRTAPPDLARFAKRNRDKFDEGKVARIIDGRDPVKGHGGADMPVWGDAFKRSGEGYSEKAVKVRIDSIVEFLKSIQIK